MKTNLILTFILFIFALFFPFIIFAFDGAQSGQTEENISETVITEVQESSTAETETVTESVTEKENIETVSVLSVSSGKVTEISLFDYLVGTVSAEMPASYHEEALKAQAVACYTYLKWIKENSESDTSDITDSSSKHQAYLTDSELKEKWGKNYDIYRKKIEDVVNCIQGEYLEYSGETAMTVYHALSCGKTNSAQEVWDSAVPYLVSVNAPGDKLSESYKNIVTVSREDFCKKLSDFNISLDEEKISDSIKTDESGYFSSLEYDNEILFPSDIRSAFSLDSLNFKISTDDGTVTFTVYGKGHGVGMSQYSADYMARQGYAYDEILAHFYKGTTLEKQ